MQTAQCGKCRGSGCDPEYGNHPLTMETCPVCYGKGEIKLTKAQHRVYMDAKAIGDWFLSNQIDCQQRTLSALVELKLVETHYPSGGPLEYNII